MHRNMLVIWIRLHNSDTTNRVFARNGDLESVSYVLLELNHKTVINIHLKKKDSGLLLHTSISCRIQGFAHRDMSGIHTLLQLHKALLLLLYTGGHHMIL